LRKALIAVFLLIAGPALAVDLPVNGTYGAGNGCALFAKGGRNAVFVEAQGRDTVITPKLIVSYEMAISTFEKSGKN
jgi:hypothetical protein